MPAAKLKLGGRTVKTICGPALCSSIDEVSLQLLESYDGISSMVNATVVAGRQVIRVALAAGAVGWVCVADSLEPERKALLDSVRDRGRLVVVLESQGRVRIVEVDIDERMNQVLLQSSDVPAAAALDYLEVIRGGVEASFELMESLPPELHPRVVQLRILASVERMECVVEAALGIRTAGRLH